LGEHLGGVWPFFEESLIVFLGRVAW